MIERKLFLSKLSNYFNELNKNYIKHANEEYDTVITHIINEQSGCNEFLYDNYINSHHEQDKLLKHLLYVSLVMASVIVILFIIALINALIYRKFINWKHIMIENICMFVLLGVFEYLFFTMVIIRFSPITDEELEYIACNNMVDIINGTYL